MKTYVVTNLIKADPMTRLEYNEFRGWEVPADENGSDEGYMVEYVNGGFANTTKYEGYVSWLSKDVFEKFHRESGSLTFGVAIKMAKQGYKIARKGWNGKGMWVILVPGTPVDQIPEWAPGSAYDKAGVPNGCEILPHFDMYTVNAEGRRAMLPGWLASQSDMLADDWEVFS